MVFTQIRMLGATWTDQGNYDTSWYDDFSTSFDIYTPEQFAGFVFLSNNNTSFEGKTINLRADLDMGKYEFTMCENFAGTLNGNGYSISNVTIKRVPYSAVLYAAIFCSISETGSVESVKITNSSHTVSGSECYFYVGGIVCKNYGIINACQFNGEISAVHAGYNAHRDYFVGGIASYNYGKIMNCAHLGNVIANPSLSARYYKVYAGGIVGYNEGIIANCINYGNIFVNANPGSDSDKTWAGGICGYSKSIINNVINLADITATGNDRNVTGDGVCAYGECSNAYYSSSNKISAPIITKNGTLLSIEQIRNKTLDFTSILNENLLTADFTPKTYWANSPDYNNNEPFLLNSLNLNLQCAGATQSSVNVACLPLQLTSSWITEKGFEYQKDGSPIVNTIVVKDSFSAEITDLEAETIYNIRAYVKGKTGIVYSKTVSYKTLPLKIQTLEATEITPVSAVLNGKINVGNTPIKSQGFLWKEFGGNYNVITTQGTGFSAKIDNLKPSSTYVYQAYAIDENDKSIYGDEVNFKTSPVTVAVVNKTADINAITIEGCINLQLSANITVEYRQSGNGVYIRKNVTSDSSGNFKTILNDLKANTEYEIRTYFIYENVTVYSPVEILRTLSINVFTLAPLVDDYIEFYGEINGYTTDGEFGFEYRETNIPDIIPSKFISATIKDNKFSAKTTDVVNGTNYKVRAYYKSGSNEYSYGEWIEFHPVNVAGVDDITTDGSDLSIKVIGTEMTIEGAEALPVAVYTIDGRLCATYNSYNGESISLGKGCYIVRAGNNTAKVMI